jgi:hypothetical protein
VALGPVGKSLTLQTVSLSAKQGGVPAGSGDEVRDGSVVLDPAGLRSQGDDEVIARRAGSGASTRGRRRCFSCFSVEELASVAGISKRTL